MASASLVRKRIYQFHRNKYIPASFWLFVLDKAAFWDQSPCVIKDEEEVEIEWQDVKFMSHDPNRLYRLEYDNSHIPILEHHRDL